MSTINYTYNVIVDRFRQFAEGHFQLRRFTHGEISQADLEKEAEWPWLHVKPRAINYSPGTRSFSFEIFISDLPRDKEDKTGYQAESITDCSLIFQDLINEIYLGNMFGSDVVLTRPVNAEPFVEQYTHTLTGVTGTIELNLDYDWSACSIPASWNYNTPTDSPSDGWGALQFIESLDQNGVFVSLLNDEEAPGNSYYYGTNASGVKGWYATEAGGLTCEDLPDCAVIISITDDIASLQSDMLLKANIADLGATAFSNSYNDLDNLPTIPAAQVNSDWNATSGVSEILNKPTIPAAQIQSDWNQSNNVALDYIKNKPTIPASGLPAGGTAGQILTKVDATDYNATWQENFADWTSVVKHIVKNNGLSGTITKGTAVYVTGSNGTNMLVGRASNTSEATSSKTMGLMQSDITTTGGNQTGFVITEGLLEGLNTASATAGDPVWLGVNGALIYGLANKPYAPAHLVFIGIVTKVSAGNGEIFVKVQNGFELKEIHDVDLITTTPINGHVLGFDGTLWVNKTVASWLGFTPVTDARTISTTAPLSGGGNLSANRTLSIAQATNSTDGYLSSTDWNTFNGKQAALGFTPENAANKQNSLATDGTGVKFPTVDAVNNLSFIDKGKRMVSFFTDFYGNELSRDGLISATSGGIVAAQSLAAAPQRTNQIGVHTLSTSTAATNWANHVSSGVASMYLGNGAWVYETSINSSNLSTALERFRIVSGFGSNNSNTQEGDGVFFTYDEGGTLNGTAASPNWQCVTVANVVRTLTTTSVAVVNAAWIKLRIEINAAGTSVAFYINGALVATHTTNIPLGSNNRFVLIKQGIHKTIGITNRVMWVDYLGYENIQTTSRT